MIALKNLDLRLLLGLVLLFIAAAPAVADGPFKYFPLTPCRVADTRGPNGVNGGPSVPAWQTRSFSVQGNCGVPVGAKAVSLNVTVVTPSEAGWLGLYPSTTGFSGTSTLNFATGEFAIANGAIVPLSNTQNDVAVIWGTDTSNPGQTHLILDATGYFMP